MFNAGPGATVGVALVGEVVADVAREILKVPGLIDFAANRSDGCTGAVTAGEKTVE